MRGCGAFDPRVVRLSAYFYVRAHNLMNGGACCVLAVAPLSLAASVMRLRVGGPTPLIAAELNT